MSRDFIKNLLHTKPHQIPSVENKLYKYNIRILPLSAGIILVVSLYWFLMDLVSDSYSLDTLSKAGVLLQMAAAFGMFFLRFILKHIKSEKTQNIVTRISYHLYYYSILIGILALTTSRNRELVESGAKLSNVGVSIIVFYVFLIIFMPFPRMSDSIITIIGITACLIIPPMIFKGMTYLVMANGVLISCYTISYFCYRQIMLEKVLNENEVKELTDKLTVSSITDPLTHALNRLALDDYIKNLLEDPSNQKLGVVFFDIDYFKQYNDHYGHVSGDEVLKKITETVDNLIADKPDRSLFRFGGEEFVVLINNADEDMLISQMRDIRNAVIKANIVRDDIPEFKHVTVTVGGAIEPLPNERGDYITNADNQLYLGKKNSRNCIYYQYVNYDLDTKNVTVVSTKERIISEFYNALKNNEFSVFVQPKHSARNKEILGGEALVRWKSESGFISPGIFIPALEESRQIVQLDIFVFEQVCIRLREILDSGNHPFPISVNMSRVTLFMTDTVSKYLDILQKYDIPAHLTPIELTESYSQDGCNIKESLNELKNAGFLIYFDDFGSGYASLSNLYMLPFNTVKLDKSLIDGIGREESEELLRHIIELSHFLKHDVIAEGVETSEQYLFLKKLNCDSIQGYYFNKPMPFDDYIAVAEQSYQRTLTLKNSDKSADDIGSLRVTNDSKLQYLSALAGIYMTMHVIDLKEDTVTEFATTTNVRENANQTHNARAQMIAVMKSVTSPEYLDSMLEFTDLNTVAERMIGKRSISKDFKGTHFGWTRAQFVAVNIDESEIPTKVIYTTEVISASNDSKGEKSVCVTDELTGVNNRLSLEYDIDKISNSNDIKAKSELSVLLTDVNGLRRVNLLYGRNAGDELIRATAECLKSVYGQYGKVYRFYDDIFVVFYYAEREIIDSLGETLHDTVRNWMGNNVRSLSISYGSASAWEFETIDPESLIKEAKKRMLDYKVRSYKK